MSREPTRLMLLVVPAIVAAASAPVRAAEPYVGRWAINPNACTEEGDTAETTVLTLTERSLHWFTTDCTFRSPSKRREWWHARGRCSGEGETGPLALGWRVTGGMLVVDWGGSPVEKMQRCPVKENSR